MKELIVAMQMFRIIFNQMNDLVYFSFRNKLEDICFRISCEHISEHFSSRNAGNLLSKQSQYNVTLARIFGILWITVGFVSLSRAESSSFFSTAQYRGSSMTNDSRGAIRKGIYFSNLYGTKPRI